MPKTTFQMKNSDTIETIDGGIGIYTFTKGMSRIATVIGHREFEIGYFETAVSHFSHYTTIKYLEKVVFQNDQKYSVDS